MKDLEFNKMFAALLVAGITAMATGMVADGFVHSEELEKDAIPVEVSISNAAGAAAAPTGPTDIAPLLAAANIEKGKKAAKACLACHSFDKGGADGTGPNLYDIVNRPIAASAGFSYSDAMAARASDAWTYEELNHFIYKPKAHISGTKMNYVGLKKDSKRADLIAWLRTLSDNPAALPEIVAIEEAVEEVTEEIPTNE